MSKKAHIEVHQLGAIPETLTGEHIDYEFTPEGFFWFSNGEEHRWIPNRIITLIVMEDKDE